MIRPNDLCFASSSPAAPADADEAPDTPASRAAAAKAELAVLVARAAAGQPAAQSELMQRYLRRIAGFVRTIVRQPDAVDDVTQVVFIKMFRRLGRLRDAGAFESWLFMLARNTALDWLRRQRRRPATVSIDDEVLEIPDTRQQCATGEIMDALQGALVQLTPQTRTLITMFVQGHSYRTLADREGITLGAVKARLHRARPLLRACIGAAMTGRAVPTLSLSAAAQRAAA